MYFCVSFEVFNFDRSKGCIVDTEIVSACLIKKSVHTFFNKIIEVRLPKLVEKQNAFETIMYFFNNLGSLKSL